MAEARHTDADGRLSFEVATRMLNQPGEPLICRLRLWLWLFQRMRESDFATVLSANGGGNVKNVMNKKPEGRKNFPF